MVQTKKRNIKKKQKYKQRNYYKQVKEIYRQETTKKYVYKQVYIEKYLETSRYGQMY